MSAELPFVVLASKSPRRKELLGTLGFDFRTVSFDADESFPNEMKVEGVAEFIANKKKKAFEGDLKYNEVLLTADTVVIVDNEILGKPKSEEEALEMIMKLSNKSHQVVTGVCLSNNQKSISFSVISNVWFTKISEFEAKYYIQNYSPLDKAGAYGIQEWLGYCFVEKIEGSYNNIVGLPTSEVYHKLCLEFAC